MSASSRAWPCPTCKAKAHQPCRSLKNARVTDTHVARLEPQEVHPATCTQCSTIDTRGTDHPDYGWLCAVCSHRQYSKDEGWRTNYK